MSQEEFIGECRMRLAGCHVLFLIWRKDRKPVCSNRTCRSSFYRSIRTLLNIGLGFTESKILSLLNERRIEAAPGLPNVDEVRAELEKRIVSCEIQAPGCKGTVLLYRKDKLHACGNLKCRKRAEQRRLYRAGRAK